ncbi:MAG: tRNA pseudouridine(55) synthase TruB [Anaerolineae bacterium]|nr:MAG: tRNA pseudouridine(55) synthase TruB [Anaerolineae bacterium]
MAGILNVNKPAGVTSHDVVAAIRRAARVRRVGHAGTLDPLATGVLLVCLDQATRVSRYLVASDKVYRAHVRLGQMTDTDDAEGQVTRQQPVPAHLDAAAIEEALAGFVGQIDQLPPRYAAIKQDGVPLYRLARQGFDPQPTPRQVVVHAISLLAWHDPDLTVEVHCGPGTYIRALARDLGEQLGCGGHLAGLVRLRSGAFSLETATDLDQALRRLQSPAGPDVADILWPLDAALTGLARMAVDAETEERLRHGQQVAGPPPQPDESQPALRRVYADDGTLVAIARYDPGTGLWQPETVFDLRPAPERARPS